MKLLIVLTTLLAQGVQAQNCTPLSKEMEQYQKQQSWSQSEVQDSQTPGAVSGVRTPDGSFYFNDLTRAGSFRSQLNVDPQNVDFISNCKSFETKGRYLRMTRKSLKNNKYSLKLRFLPSFASFKNDPIKDQRLKVHQVQLRMMLAKDSVSLTQDYEPEKYRREIYAHIQSQLEKQPVFGEVFIDLTNYDDFVCDLVQKKASITLEIGASSNAPMLEQRVVIAPSDIQSIYSALKENIEPDWTQEEMTFRSARRISKLEQERVISPFKDEIAFTIFSRLMDQTGKKLSRLDSGGLLCVSDSLQSYWRPTLNHVLNIQFKMDSLELIESESMEK